MACDATARLYDVDEKSVVFEKLQRTEKYDQGRFTFHARKGKLIDLDKLHESIWATRLSGGTRSGLVSLDVSAIGKIVSRDDQTLLRVEGADAEFVLSAHPEAKSVATLLATTGDQRVKVTGRIADYRGRWPGLLAKKPPRVRHILVMDVEPLENVRAKAALP